jgi:hypothetical protein
MGTAKKLQMKIGSEASKGLKVASFLAFNTLVVTRRPDPRHTEGQHAWLLLAEYRPDLAKTLRGNSVADPYLNDSNLPAFWRAVELLW